MSFKILLKNVYIMTGDAGPPPRDWRGCRGAGGLAHLPGTPAVDVGGPGHLHVIPGHILCSYTPVTLALFSLFMIFLCISYVFWCIVTLSNYVV